MTEQTTHAPLSLDGSERPVAAASAAASLAALFSAAACCVLPVVFALAGLGTSGLVPFVPWHWPLTIASGAAVVIGWALYFRKRRACAGDASCAAQPPTRATFVLLSVATAFVLLSVVWKAFLEAPLRDWLMTL